MKTIPTVAVVTGAGSGVGQATALALAHQGWRVALVGRRRAALEETARCAPKLSSRLLVCPCDIRDPAAVQRMARRALKALGPVEVLVNAAGTNTPRRSLAELSDEDYRLLVETLLKEGFLTILPDRVGPPIAANPRLIA